ncbi:MAG: hypothetical protein ABI743_10660, partial [bacterium]
VQLLPAVGAESTIIAISDPASNRCKLRYVDLDGNGVAAPRLGNGPDPWASGLRPFSGFAGPELPFAAYRDGAIEAIQTEEGIFNFLRLTGADPTLVPIWGDKRDAVHPGHLPPLSFPATWWSVQPRSGAIVAAGETGLYRFTDKWERVPLQLPEDLQALEVAADDTMAVLSGVDRNHFALTSTLYTADGRMLGRIDIADLLEGPATIMDQANLGQDGGFLLLAILAPPWPVALTQYINDETRVLLDQQGSMPFLFRFNWSDGTLAALTPLPTLGTPLGLARVSGDAYTTVVLAMSGETTALHVLSTPDLSEVGTISLPLAHPGLDYAGAIDWRSPGILAALDQVHEPGMLVPTLELKTFDLATTGQTQMGLLPLLAGSRFDATGLQSDPVDQYWCGGQVISEVGVSGSWWQRVGSDGVNAGDSLFSSLPIDLFNLGTGSTQGASPYLLAEGRSPEGDILAIAGTFTPAASWLLRYPGSDVAHPVQETLPDGFDIEQVARISLDGLAGGGMLLATEAPDSGGVLIQLRRTATDSWTTLERFSGLGFWPLGIHPDGRVIWNAPGIGLLTSDLDEHLERIAPNASPFLGAITDTAVGNDADYLLLRDLGQVWGVPQAAYVEIPSYGDGETNDALLELADALTSYREHVGVFPPDISPMYLGSDLKRFRWEDLWDRCIGGQPLLYQSQGGAFDLVVWTADHDQRLWHLSEKGTEPYDPTRGFTPANRRNLDLELGPAQGGG